MENTTAAWRFAQEEYGHAKMGHQARVQALIRVSALYTERPGSKVTDVCERSCDRQAVYKFIENDKVEVQAIRKAAAIAALRRRPTGAPYILVPLDGTSLNVTDDTGRKGFGFVGAHDQHSTGVQVLNAIGVGSDGTPLGVLGQRYWARKGLVQGTKKARERRAHEEKETRHWVELMDEIEAVTEEAAPGVQVWFQADRGFDAWVVLKRLQETRHLYTIRNVYNRVISDGGKKGKLHLAMDEAPIHYREIRTIPSRQKGGSRRAELVVRATPVTLILRDPHMHKGKHPRRLGTGEGVDGVYHVSVYAIWVHEENAPVESNKSLEWMLLTNWRADSESEVKRVIEHYMYRWRIEEFHRLWKSGAMKVEETQVRDFEHLEIVASITASVACYLFRLTHIARTDPQRPASEVLETNALLALECLHAKATREMTLAQAVLYIADLGGYTGPKNSGGPPGPLVLSRGYHRLMIAAETIHAFIKKRDQC